MVAQLLNPTDHQAKVEIAMRFPMDDILDRYCKEQGIPMELAKQHERELKRFLILCAINPSARYGMAGPVDELWHTFIVFTRDYERFCQQVAGRFIHHAPVTAERDRASSNKRPRGQKDPYLCFQEDYELVFGEKPPVEFWPNPRFLEQEDAGRRQDDKTRVSATVECNSPSECYGGGGVGEGGCVGSGRPTGDSDDGD